MPHRAPRNQYAAAKAALAAFIASLFEARPDDPVWKWAEANIELSERESANHGQYSTLLTPYIREPMDCFRNKRLTDLTLCFGTQTSKTLMIMCGVAWRIVHDPTPTLWVMPNKDLAGEFSDNRWKPLCEACDAIRRLIPKDRRRLWKRTSQFFARVTLALVGSNSPANLASRPAGLLLLDEVDKFKEANEREASALHLAEERTKTFPFPFRVKTSTPTNEWGEIWKEFLKGDQRYYWMPCPHCALPDKSNWIKFEFKNLRWWRLKEEESKTDGAWDFEKVRVNAHYRCSNDYCQGEITDSNKIAMERVGEWRASNPHAPSNRRSYHLNSLYAPWDSCSWAAISIKWLQDKDIPSARQNFINSWLAQCYGDDNAWDDAPLLVDDYEVSKLFDPKLRIPLLTIDQQQNGYWAVARLWQTNMESWLLWAGYLETEEQLVELQEKYGILNKHVTVDMADDTNRAAQLIVKHKWRGVWGSPKPEFPWVVEHGRRVKRVYSPADSRDAFLGTAYAGNRNMRAKFVYFSKDGLSELLDVLRGSLRWHIGGEFPEDYQFQLNAERKLFKENQHGNLVGYYRQIRRKNHLRDCEKHQIVNAMVNGIIADAKEIMYQKPKPVFNGEVAQSVS